MQRRGCSSFRRMAEDTVRSIQLEVSSDLHFRWLLLMNLSERIMEYIIEDTKTTSGTRDVTMTAEVAECFRRIIRERKIVCLKMA